MISKQQFAADWGTIRDDSAIGLEDYRSALSGRPCKSELILMECPRCRRTVDSKTLRCGWCGINVPLGQHLLEESGVVVPIRPAEHDAGQPQRTRLATLGDRLIAVLLDSVIVLLACAVVDVWAFMKWGVVAGTELHITTAVVLIGGSLNVLIVFLYAWLLEASFGCTLGKAMVGIGVVNNSGRSSLAASGIRNLLRVVDGIGFYLVGTLVASCSQSRRRIGDLCAGTYVIEGDFSNLAKSLAVLGWLAVLGGGAWTLPHAYNRPKPSQSPRHFGHVVVAIGRTENSIYVRAPHQGIDLSLVNETPAENTGRGSDQEIGRASKLDDPETIREVR